MSVAVLERGLTLDSETSERMPGGIAISAGLHIGILAAIIIGLPSFFHPPVPEDQPIAVELVTIAPETHATHPNPNLPKPNAKPDIPLNAAPAPKPEPKPELPPPAPITPPSAAPPPAPAPSPTPAAPDQAVPPPPPPLPKPVEAQTPPPPPPKPPEPKPKPQPKQVATTQAPPDAKQPDTMAFDSLLKNLTKTTAVPTEEAPPVRQQRAAAAPPSSQPRAPLGSQLTASEIDLVREQLSRCWNINAGARDAKDLVVQIRASVNPDGTVTRAEIVDMGRMGDPLFRAAAESARRTFFNPACTPLKLPPDKYATWKDLVVDFSPKDIQ
jgi:outer membrane biosynthesis protein TonB